MALTARGSAYRDSTLRELKKNNMDFSISGIGVNADFPGEYLPYELSHVEDYGLTAQEMSDLGIKKARSVSYINGVMMVAGQHKGLMLRTLLHKTKRTFDAIIFVDDKEKNTTNMQQGFEHSNIDLTTIRYTKEDSTVNNFNHGDKEIVNQAWKDLKQVIKRVFP